MAKCPKCLVELKDGDAFTVDYYISPDFGSEWSGFLSEKPDYVDTRGQTMHEIARLPLRTVKKCPKCGYSREPTKEEL